MCLLLVALLGVAAAPAQSSQELAANSANGRAGAGASSDSVDPSGVSLLPNPFIAPRPDPYIRDRQIWEQKIRDAEEGRFQWGSAIAQSAVLLAIEHSYRVADQPDTRANLKGPFFKDWVQSVQGLSGWDDGDSKLANYVAHPFQGAITGYFQIQNDPRGRIQEFGKSRSYWMSRMKAFAWSAGFSTIYELSPVGDAGIGNVGHKYRNPGAKGAVDLVITPTLGLGLILLQDFIDLKVVAPIERRTDNAWIVRLTRSFLVMHRSFANLFRFKRPWYVDSRGPAIAPVHYSRLPVAY